ncbi:MAG: PilZ domain-containing protein [Pseudomonadota bacterium]
MTTSSGSERRNHPRYSPGGLFRIHGGDAREETTQATNQGPGGAFLPVRRAMPEGTLLILDVHDPEAAHRGPPVLLVAEVMYSKQEPVQGVGIRWKHALCAEGIERLSTFLETHFNLFLDPQKIGAFHREQLDGAIQYDFQFGTMKPISEDTLEQWRGEQRIFDVQYPQTFMAKADHIETRARGIGLAAVRTEGVPSPLEIGREELSLEEVWEPPAVSFADGDDGVEDVAVSPPPAVSSPLPAGMSAPEVDDETDIGFDNFTQEIPAKENGERTTELAEWASEMRQRMRVRIPVLILPMAGDETFGGMVRVLSRTALFVMVEEVRIYCGDRVVIRFPLSLGPLSVKLIFVCSVQRMARDRKSGQLGLDLTIETLDEGRNQGIFKEFVSALRRRLDPI